MAPRNPRATAPFVHALIAVGVIFVLISSWWMMALPLPSKVFTYRAFPFQLHKNVGITVAALVAVLLYLRLKYVLAARAAGRPRPRTSVQNVLLYGLVLACCVSGYLSSAYSGWGTRLWWLVDLPNWGYDNDELNDLYAAIHTWTSYGLLVIILAHVGDVIYDAFRNGGTARRMLRL